MKKTSYIFILAILLLTACGGGNTEAGSPDQAAVDNNAQIAEDAPVAGTGEGRQPSEINALLIGTFMLEDTENAITADQAENLLPLWKLAQNLIGSGTAADAEIQAVADQIQSVMTETQLALITESEYTTQDLFAQLEEMGISLLSENAESGTSAQPGSGFGGGQGAGRSGVPGDGELTDEQRAEMEARRAAGGVGGGGILNNPAVFDSLIDLLEGKIN